MKDTAMVKQEQGIEESHILQNSRDRLAVKIAKWRGENITAQEQEDLNCNKERYFNLFIHLSKKLEGLSPKLILKLDRDEFLALEECIYERAMKKYNRFIYIWQPFLLSVPLIGWIVLAFRYKNPEINDFPACNFITSRRKLEKLLGKNFFQLLLADEFLEYLKKS